MSSYGVTDTGFVIKPLDVVKDELEAALQAELGDGINLLSTSVLGQIVAIMAEREHDVWELMEDVYASQYPSGATGQSADAVAAITGVERLVATKSTVTLSVNIDAGVTLQIGRIVSQGSGSDVRFVTTEAVTNSGGAPADFDVAAEAEDTGPTAAVAGTLTYIETPVTGWNTVTNALDAVPGRDLETDAALMVRRAGLLRADGAAALDAIISDVVAVTGVTSVSGFQNVTDVTDGDGVPPHSIEMLVLGGTDQDIIDAIFGAIAAGIQAHGSTSGTATDINGGSHAVKFTRPTEVDIWAIVDVTTDSDYPADGDAQIKAALVADGDALGVGADVIQSAMYEPVFSISGVVDVTKIWIGTSDPPTGGANITIAARELSAWDTSRITVNAT